MWLLVTFLGSISITDWSNSLIVIKHLAFISKSLALKGRLNFYFSISQSLTTELNYLLPPNNACMECNMLLTPYAEVHLSCKIMHDQVTLICYSAFHFTVRLATHFPEALLPNNDQLNNIQPTIPLECLSKCFLCRPHWGDNMAS